MFHVNTSLIRFWEKEFNLLSPQKNPQGKRLFTRKDIEDFRLIYHLVKEKGHTLQGAREALRQKRADVEKEVAVKTALENIRSFLLDLKKELK